LSAPPAALVWLHAKWRRGGFFLGFTVSYHSELMAAGAELVFDVLGDAAAAVYTPADGSAVVTFSSAIIGAVTTEREDEDFSGATTTKRKQMLTIRVPAAEFTPPQLAGSIVVAEFGATPWGIRRIVELGEHWAVLELERAEVIGFQRRGTVRGS
jgi:hypothetical protein